MKTRFGSAVLLASSIVLTASAADPWQPAVGTTWQIVLGGKINATSAFTKQVEAIDGDLFANTKDGADPNTIFGALHKHGKKIICYFSAGTYEPYRPDSSQYDQRDLGAKLPDWPDERWVDIRSDRIRAVIANRIELAGKMGCDAIDPDNMDGYANQNGGGFNPPLTKQDSIDLIRIMATQAEGLGMSIGLKNALEIIPDVVDDVHFAVNEECAKYKECADLQPFIDNGKPVFHIEYPAGAGSKKGVTTKTLKRVCGAKGASQFSTLIKSMKLNGWTETCDGKVYK